MLKCMIDTKWVLFLSPTGKKHFMRIIIDNQFVRFLKKIISLFWLFLSNTLIIFSFFKDNTTMEVIQISSFTGIAQIKKFNDFDRFSEMCMWSNFMEVKKKFKNYVFWKIITNCSTLRNKCNWRWYLCDEWIMRIYWNMVLWISVFFSHIFGQCYYP